MPEEVTHEVGSNAPVDEVRRLGVLQVRMTPVELGDLGPLLGGILPVGGHGVRHTCLRELVPLPVEEHR